MTTGHFNLRLKETSIRDAGKVDLTPALSHPFRTRAVRRQKGVHAPPCIGDALHSRENAGA